MFFMVPFLALRITQGKQVSANLGHGAWRMGHGVEILKLSLSLDVPAFCALRYALCFAPVTSSR
jgi:hypothetical protein